MDVYILAPWDLLNKEDDVIRISCHWLFHSTFPPPSMGTPAFEQLTDLAMRRLISCRGSVAPSIVDTLSRAASLLTHRAIASMLRGEYGGSLNLTAQPIWTQC